MFLDRYFDRNFSNDDTESGYNNGENFWSAKSLQEQAEREIKDGKNEKFLYDIKSTLMTERWRDHNALDMTEAYLRIKNCDLKFYIILDRDGRIVDGFHRVVKAIIEEKEVYAVRLIKMPEPTRRVNE